MKQFFNKITPKPIIPLVRYCYSFVPPNIRAGKTFRDTLKFILSREYLTEKEHQEYQIRKLEELLKYAYNYVPYYRRIFNQRNLKPNDIQNLYDLKQLPFLTKFDIQNNLNDLLSRRYPKKYLKYTTTGGSTGIPLGLYHEKYISDEIEWAFIVSQWMRVGFKLNDRRVILRGNIIKNSEKGKFYEYNPVHNILVISSYHLIDSIIPRLIDKIRKFEPKFLHVYPSTLTILANYFKENDIQPINSLKAVLCGSENLYDWQRSLFEQIFKCRVFSWYGHEERAILASECEQSNRYHIVPEYGIAEFVSKEGNTNPTRNELVEIIGTSLTNFACPLIRYKTMDLALYSDQKCECGRNYKMINGVEGRLQEILVSNDNRMITMTAINMHSDVFDNVKQFQFYQENRGEVILYIVKKSTYNDLDHKKILNELHQKLGNNFKVEIKFKKKIDRTHSGKYRFLIQKLKLNFGD